MAAEWIVSAVLSAAGVAVAYMTARWSRRSSREAEATSIMAEHREWLDDRDALRAEQRTWEREQREWVEQRLNAELSDRDAKIERLEERVGRIESKYRAALEYIRALLERIREHTDEAPSPPAEIHHDI